MSITTGFWTDSLICAPESRHTSRNRTTGTSQPERFDERLHSLPRDWTSRQRDIATAIPPLRLLHTYKMRLSITTLFSLLSFIYSTYAQSETGSAANAVASPDGLIVPFTSGLPPCATLCGPLFDVQGACTPPNIPTVNDNCFCTDSRLSAFDTDAGTTGVSAVCGPESCNAPADLQAIKTWFDNFCNTKQVVTTTAAGGAVSTSTGSSQPSSGGGGNTWYVLIWFISFF